MSEILNWLNNNQGFLALVSILIGSGFVWKVVSWVHGKQEVDPTEHNRGGTTENRGLLTVSGNENLFQGTQIIGSSERGNPTDLTPGHYKRPKWHVRSDGQQRKLYLPLEIEGFSKSTFTC